NQDATEAFSGLLMTNFFTLQYLLYWLIIFSFFTTPIFSQPTSRIAPTIKEWAQSMFMPSKKQHLIPEFEDSYGVVFRDLNNDGLPDLYVVRFRELNRLFLNQGDEQLVMDYTIPSGLGGNLMARKEENLELGASAVDFNNDGAQDVLIVGWGLTTYLFHQSGRLNFPENTPLAIEHFPLDGNCGVWADIDRDGDLDLFITDEHYPNHLFINKDGYGFSEQASQFGLDLNAVSQGAVFADFNNDDYPDLYVCNWFAPDVFYRNVQGKSFQAVNIPIYHLQENVNSNGVSAGDVDNDGDLDLLVTDRNGTSKLYLNKTPRGGEEFRFEESPTTHFPGNPYPAYGSIIADFNNDGSQDIYISNIGPNLFLLNNGHGGFQISYKDSMATLSSNRYYSTGSAVADYDLDGDLDLFVANKDTLSQLLINPLTNRSSIRFVLEGVLSNRDAIGSKIWLYLTFPGDSTVLVGFQEISGGSGYLSMNEPIAHFGTVERGIYSARIRFPSGREIQLDDLRPGSVYFVSEVKGIQKTLIRFWQSIRRIVHGRNFWVNLLLFLGLLGLISSFLWMATQRYQWQNRQLVYFLIVTFFISYGVFAILSSTSLKNILLVQFGIFTGGIAVLVVFLEKLLRIEQQRYGYRQLLRQFSEELIFIKNNTELYQKMVEIIQKAL
ncbi:MAG: CRTAC1 family protein, partial [Methanobacteriota archaeon]